MNAEPVRLPSALRPRPHHPLLRRSPSRLRLGFVNRAVEVAELSGPLWRLVALLPNRVTWRTTELISAGVALGAAPSEVSDLLGQLYAVGALGDGAALARRDSVRAAARVLVEGAGPLLVEVAAGLAEAGVGRIAVRAPTWLTRARPQWRRVRSLLTEAETRAAATGRVVDVTTLGPPDLVVFTDLLTVDPDHRQGLHQEKIAHLVVRLADGQGLIGPLVLPGRSSCLSCAELHLGDGDADWSIIARQGRELVGGANPATLRACAGFGVGQAVAFIEALATPTDPPTCVDGLLTLDAEAGTLHREHWPPHGSCECGASTATVTPVNPQRPAACTQWATR
jgi:bacteriocin biosynthesis cyclodehydratase domain-containing protein